MFGVGDYPQHPPALKSMIALVRNKLPTVPVMEDVPRDYPNTFITVDVVGGDELAGGLVSNPRFAYRCYSMDSGGAEELCALLLAVLKSAQFTKYGNVQYRHFVIVGLPQRFDNPSVPGRRSWQLTGTFAIS